MHGQAGPPFAGALPSWDRRTWMSDSRSLGSSPRVWIAFGRHDHLHAALHTAPQAERVAQHLSAQKTRLEEDASTTARALKVANDRHQEVRARRSSWKN